MSETPRTASAERFAEQINAIQGVEQFALVRNDGRIVTHNLPEPEALSEVEESKTLWEVILAMAEYRCFLRHTDHLSVSLENDYHRGIILHI